jgi:hypothetical protein
MKPIRIIKRKPDPPCNCVAYPFPHRAGGGDCGDPGPEPRSCDECPGLRVGDYGYRICEHDFGYCPWGVT